MSSGPARLRLHRPIDLVVAAVGLIASAPILVVAWLAAGWAANGSGVFRQTRVGKDAKLFEIVKFRTMRADSAGTTVTTSRDMRITGVGRLLRRSKLDEVPQLINVLLGDMALIGPRPDVPGFADLLTGADRRILEVRPGITGPASLACAREEQLLAAVADPECFNSDVLYPLKTAINRAWIQHGTLADDVRILVWTIRPPAQDRLEAMLHRWCPSLDLTPLHQIG